jgi:hypothetical protein
MNELSQQQILAITELNKRFQTDSTQFNENQRMAIKELSKRAGIGVEQQKDATPTQSVLEPIITPEQFREEYYKLGGESSVQKQVGDPLEAAVRPVAELLGIPQTGIGIDEDKLADLNPLERAQQIQRINEARKIQLQKEQPTASTIGEFLKFGVVLAPMHRAMSVASLGEQAPLLAKIGESALKGYMAGSTYEKQFGDPEKALESGAIFAALDAVFQGGGSLLKILSAKSAEQAAEIAKEEGASELFKKFKYLWEDYKTRNMLNEAGEEIKLLQASTSEIKPRFISAEGELIDMPKYEMNATKKQMADYKPKKIDVFEEPTASKTADEAVKRTREAIDRIFEPVAKMIKDAQNSKELFTAIAGTKEDFKAQDFIKVFLREKKPAQEDAAKLVNFGKRIQNLKPEDQFNRMEEYLSKNFPEPIKEVKVEAPKVEPPVEEVTPAQKLLDALREAKPARRKQEKIYTQERKAKMAKFQTEPVTSEESFVRQRAKLGGEMTKVDFEPLREAMSQENMDALFKDLYHGQNDLMSWERVAAGNELIKIFDGKVPTKSGIAYLERAFGKDVADELGKKISLFQKVKEMGMELANIPRSIMASMDLSFGFRQGIAVVARHPKIFFSNFAKQFKLFGSESYYKELMGKIHSDPDYELAMKSGLSLTELGDLAKREEAFMSNWAEKITGGKYSFVRASGRAYTGFADKLRFDIFKYMKNYGEKFGVTEDAKYLKDVSNFINISTGRGKLPGRIELVAPELNSIFFSPRLIMSRLRFLYPGTYVGMHPIARREALKTLLSFGGMALTVGGMAKMAGADVEFDPRNSDFMKIKVGNTRFDILGGFQQPIRAAAQIINGEVISSTTGKTIKLGEGYRALTRPEIAQRFFEMKLSPMASFAISVARGTNTLGEKMDIPTEVFNRFIPMVAQDAADLYRERGLEGIPMAVPGIFGVGTQTYGGVESYGLWGKDYPELQKELRRIGSSMGFPSSSAFGQEFTIGEYKKFERESGKRIAEELTSLIKTEYYKKSEDFEKKQIIEKTVDEIKASLKEEMFPDKKEISEIKKDLIGQGTDEDKAEELAKNIFKSQSKGKD